jgi:protein-S-isoprenylcysteine O-methyltransferase Ste14
VLGSFVFFWIAPVSVGVLGPWLITGWQREPPLFGVEGARWIGDLLILVGTVLVVECFARFAVEGRGTPAPLAPTERLVITGFYRHVRNPMYVGVVLAILGQSFWFGSTELLVYALLVWLGFFVFVLAYEEPTLERRYGAEYVRYRAHVPRWWPRLTPWRDITEDPGA